MEILMFVAAQTWNTTCIPSHDRLWVNTHTVLLTLILDQERSDLFLWVLFMFDDTHWDIGLCVCLGEMYLMLIHLYMDCAFHCIPSTFKLSFSRHFMSFKPHSPHTLHRYRTTLFPKLPPYICIPHKMFLHFRELLVTGFTPAFTHKMVSFYWIQWFTQAFTP